MREVWALAPSWTRHQILISCYISPCIQEPVCGNILKHCLCQVWIQYWRLASIIIIAISLKEFDWGVIFVFIAVKKINLIIAYKEKHTLCKPEATSFPNVLKRFWRMLSQWLFIGHCFLFICLPTKILGDPAKWTTKALLSSMVLGTNSLTEYCWTSVFHKALSY